MHKAFKMQAIIVSSRKKVIKKKYVCLPYLKFSDPLPETHIFFILPNQGNWSFLYLNSSV